MQEAVRGQSGCELRMPLAGGEGRQESRRWFATAFFARDEGDWAMDLPLSLIPAIFPAPGVFWTWNVCAGSALNRLMFLRVKALPKDSLSLPLFVSVSPRKYCNDFNPPCFL